MRRLLPLLALLCLLAPLRAQVDSLYDSSITLGAACRTAPALVLAVISDRKIARDTDANGTRDFGVYPERSRRETDVISYSDYDPGVYPERSRRGTTLPGRTGYNGSTNP
ncbi:MAG: hypothetical protein NW241_01170, partial [Bacteroidia bacterium]|nr:hypothetical protein [Bacteroidia bacterium]